MLSKRIYLGALVLLTVLIASGQASYFDFVTTTEEANISQTQLINAESQALQRNELVEIISNYKTKANRPYDLMWGVMHITILVVCIVMIRLTSFVTEGARFMRHFMYSYTVTACFYAGAVVIPYFLSYVANSSPIDSVSVDSLKSSALKLQDIDRMWSAIDSFLSLFSSLFLLIAWHLLRQYPKEVIRREFYTILNVVFGGLVAPILVGVLLLPHQQPQEVPRFPVFLVVDTLAAWIAISLFGIELWRKMRPQKAQHIPPWLRKVWPVISLPILIVFILWGVSQPAYIFYRHEPLSHWYFGGLLFLKLFAGLSVVVAASAALKERAAFRTESVPR